MNELLESDELAPHIASLTAIPSKGGKFEVIVNDKLIYSKLDTGRHAEPGEVQVLINETLNSKSD